MAEEGERRGASEELAGLEVVLDRLEHRYEPGSLPAATPHAFVYFLTIRNGSDRTVKLLGRKWVVEDGAGQTLVVEGDKIVGEEPTLAPGEHFSYQSYHLAAGGGGSARGSFHGLDASGRRVHVKIPRFVLGVAGAPPEGGGGR